MSLVAPQSERPWSERARRNVRTSGDERERAIMASAEQLLQDGPLAQISVDAIARGAGISRSAFYFYFPSKDAVVLSLMERLVDQAAAARDAALAHEAQPGPDSWRGSIAIFYEVFGAHRAVIEAAVELAASNAEARELWSDIEDGWVDDVAERIERERSEGLAPPGVPARDLATALVQMNEGALRAVFTGMRPALAEDQAIDVIAHVWTSAIYGSELPAAQERSAVAARSDGAPARA